MTNGSEHTRYLERLAWDIPCTRCGAAKGFPCLTRSGAMTPRPHEARTRPLHRAYMYAIRTTRGDTR